MQCEQCKAKLPAYATECDNCGWRPQTKAQEAIQKHKADVDNWRASQRHCAEYERRKYGLMAQFPGESDAEFVARIDREKTPAVVLDNVASFDALPERTDKPAAFNERLHSLRDKLTAKYADVERYAA